MTGAEGRPAKIAYVDHAVDTGGAEKSLLDIIERLDRSRFEPALYCSQDASWLDEARLHEVAVHRVFAPGGLLDRKRDDLRGGLLAGRRDLVGALRPVGRLWRELWRERPALVHTNTLKTHLLAGSASHLAGCRLLWHLRDILEEGNALNWLLRAARRFQPKVIAISKAVERSLGEAEVDVVVIYNGTDLSAFRPGVNREATRSSLGLKPADIAVAIVGRLTPWKGHRELLRAVGALAGEQANVKLLVVGEVAFWEDIYEAELRRMAEDLRVADRVRWLGFRKDVPDILAASDIFALPSVDEPFGRAIVEAMACEKPVVATRSGGVPEIVVEGETGLLVSPGDDGELAAALRQLTGSEELRRRMGKAGRERAMRLFDVNRTAAQVQELYAQLLAEAGV
jgi:glycosyltransferase involved in cell wall biosynthesis